MAPRGHRHTAMSDAALCTSCGERMKKAEKEYNRYVRQNPEWIKRPEPEFRPSEKVWTELEMLKGRMEKDKVYRKHRELLMHGTFEEKKLEAAKIESGYYKKHHG